jgi:hypothetical protein
MDARGNPAAAGQSARWKRVGIGCLAVLGVGGILGLVAAGVFVKIRYPWVFEAGRAGQEAMKRATTSPAVQALNDSLCSESMVLSMDDVAKFQGILGKSSRKPSYRWLVTCHVRVASSAPGCDRVARTFHQAIHESGGFMVVVTAGLLRASGKPVCRESYDADGRPLLAAHPDAGSSQE